MSMKMMRQKMIKKRTQQSIKRELEEVSPQNAAYKDNPAELFRLSAYDQR